MVRINTPHKIPVTFTPICDWTYFTITRLKSDHEATRFQLHLSRGPTTTDQLPQTVQLLQKHLPRIFTSQCFNDDQLSFRQEVKDTEIGHLFEHILLELLCKMKSTREKNSTSIRGETQWNWAIDPVGTFHIHLDITNIDLPTFYEALPQSVTLLNLILNSGNETQNHSFDFRDK